MTDAEIDKYYNWCREFETKNPADKEFVNFHYKLYGKDSIKFSQLTANTKIEYIGKVFKDSMALNYVLYPLGQGITPLPPKPISFKFYTKTNNQ